jgi:hypothetical protein
MIARGSGAGRSFSNSRSVATNSAEFRPLHYGGGWLRPNRGFLPAAFDKAY